MTKECLIIYDQADATLKLKIEVRELTEEMILNFDHLRGVAFGHPTTTGSLLRLTHSAIRRQFRSSYRRVPSRYLASGRPESS